MNKSVLSARDACARLAHACCAESRRVAAHLTHAIICAAHREPVQPNHTPYAWRYRVDFKEVDHERISWATTRLVHKMQHLSRTVVAFDTLDLNVVRGQKSLQEQHGMEGASAKSLTDFMSVPRVCLGSMKSSTTPKR